MEHSTTDWFPGGWHSNKPVDVTHSLLLTLCIIERTGIPALLNLWQSFMETQPACNSLALIDTYQFAYQAFCIGFLNLAIVLCLLAMVRLAIHVLKVLQHTRVYHLILVSAFYASCPKKGIHMNGSLWTKSKFMGMSIGVTLVGNLTLSLSQYNEVSTWLIRSLPTHESSWKTNGYDFWSILIWLITI